MSSVTTPTSRAKTKPSDLLPNRRERLAKLQKSFDAANIDALLVTRECDIVYFTGFCGHDSFLVVHQNGSVVITDSRYDEQLNPVRESGIAEVIIGTRHRLPLALADVCQDNNIGTLGIQADNLNVAMMTHVEEHLPAVTVRPTSYLVEILRMRKDADEIAAIERAIQVNEAALNATLEQLALSMTEHEFGALLEYEMKKHGASGAGFSPIVATGAHGSLPHYELGPHQIQNNQSLLIDWGSTVAGYQSDLTRTFGINSMPEKIQEMYQIVLDAQLAAIDAAKPGVVCADVDQVARDYITKHGYGDEFGHGLGHGMGLEVHEAPYFNDLQTDLSLQPGMVLTVEPGIYLPGIGGVRIEDDIVITENGCCVLSTFPKGLDVAVISI